MIKPASLTNDSGANYKKYRSGSSGLQKSKLYLLHKNKPPQTVVLSPARQTEPTFRFNGSIFFRSYSATA